MADARCVHAALFFAAVVPLSFALASDDAASQRQKPRHHLAAKFGQEGYPPLDVRLDDRGLPTMSVTAALAAASGKSTTAAWDRDLAALRAAVPSVEVMRHQVLGVASWIGATSGFLTATADGPLAVPTPEQAARAFVASYPGLFGDLTEELDAATLYGNYVTDHNGVRHLAWQQRIDGLNLHGCEVRASITSDGRVIGIASSMAPEPAAGFAVPAFGISALEALRLAARDVGVELRADPVGTRIAGEHGADPSERTVWTGAAELRTEMEVTTKKVLFLRAADDIRPAYAVVVPTHGVGHTYDTIVDATDGAILWRLNQLVWDTTQPVTYRIFTGDSPAPGSPGNPTPNGFQFPFVDPQVVTVQPDDIRAFSPNGWIPDNQSETVGNNTATHADRNGDNAPDLPRPNGGPTRDFSPLTFNSTLDPTTYTNFSVVQMFYWTNWYHDQLYSMGFNEAAGNFQTSNFSNPGAGNDAVQCDAQDGSGTNNANWQGTGVDGSANRVQMYIFPASSAITDRDGTLDGDVVFHELTHGLSTRLHRGLNSGQPRGMGEGWSDFIGITLNARPGDDVEANYCTGGYVTYGFPAGAFFDNYYFGIRRFPYSTNMNVNPLTFADTDRGQYAVPPTVPISPIIGGEADQVHNMGEVWCNTLMEGRAGLVRAYGFAGNRMMQQLVVDGMKLANTSDPTMLIERTAIIQADQVNNGGVNALTLWRAFARRGMGSNAISTSSSSTAGIVENFDIPQRVIFTYPSPLPVQLLPGEGASFLVDVAPSNLTLVPDTGRLHYSANGGAFTTVPMDAVSPSQYRATLPGFSCLDRVRFYVDVDTDAGRLSDPDAGAAMAYGAQVYTGTNVTFSDTGETDIGWTVTTTATAGGWQRGVPRSFDRGDPPADSPDAGLNCWLTQNGPTSDSDVDAGSTMMTSPPFEALDGDVFSYDFWLNASSLSSVGAGDGLSVEYATDAGGTDWRPVRSYNTASPNWRSERITVGTDLQASSTLRIRVTATDTNPANVIEAGFDNLVFARLVCDAGCAADFNRDGSVDGSDVEAFFIAWSAGIESADVDASGGVDGSDVEAFFIVWEAGGC